MFHGSMVAIVTPFTNGRVDKVALKKLIDFHLQNGTDALVPCGTTGEAATLSHEEHKKVLSFVKEYVGNKIPVICGAGSNNTEEALELTRHAKKIRAAGVLSVVPYYNKPTQEGIYRHYAYIANKVDIPIVLYNVPSRTGISIAPATVARLAKIPNIVAIKEASGSLEQVSLILNQCSITVLSGDDALTFPIMALGGKGAISVTANIVPDRVHSLTQAALEGNFERARKLHFELLLLNKAMFIETNPIPVKTALSLMRKVKAEFRLPLCKMKKENIEILKLILQKNNVM
ncbi:MAG: 4-hydroxy-tetrahydrodipicolinate synthase [Candidatus Omnitrophica bacterium]|nr:4-hydroxy-tetrahydrodipicolinate synthase [Candidatus Omnitrophota bacterium]